jgi:hypothetical protein
MLLIRTLHGAGGQGCTHSFRALGEKIDHVGIGRDGAKQQGPVTLRRRTLHAQ